MRDVGRSAVRRVAGRVAVAILGLLSLAACARPPAPAALAIVRAEATSQTSILVEFSVPVAPATAVDPSGYQVGGPGGSTLDVHVVYLRPDGRSVVLATGVQQLVPYTLSVLGVQSASGPPAAAAALDAPAVFAGSDRPAPVLASAIALEPDEVLLTFEDPSTRAPVELEPPAADGARYLLGPDGAPALGAVFAAFGSDRTRVIVTTPAQDDLDYTVTARVVAASGIPVDPTRATIVFRGISANDVVAPTVVAARAEGDAAVRVRFSEPVDPGAADPAHYEIADADGRPVPVVAAELNDVATEVLLRSWPMTRGALHEVRVSGVADRRGNVIGASATTFRVPMSDAIADDLPPRVVGAISTGPTTLVVTFDESVAGGPASAEAPQHYAIIDAATANGVAPASVLVVTQARLSANQRSVTLTTLQQSAIEYALRVVHVTDLAGNMVVGPDRDRPYQVTFFGTAVTGTALDSDGDGLSDAAEQAGWTVRVTLANGRVESHRVTSDPFDPDSDGDGVSDLDERTYGTDPRSPDTDRDGLTDFQELNQVYSEPTAQDSDGDGLLDGLEFNFFRTSPILRDTDGDQLLDGDEVVLANRNPRVADLPAPAIEIGAIDLSLDTRFTATSSQGTRDLETKTTSTTLSQTQGRSFSTTDSNTHEFFAKASAGLEYSLGGQAGVGQLTGRFSVETGYTGQWSSSFTRESSEETARAYEASRQTDREITREESVTREIVGASMRATVTLRSANTIAFTISNVEVTAFTLDPRDPGRLIPVATLRPQSNPGAAYNLGPLIPQRGPLIFESTEVFPSTIEELMRNPRGLVFKVANFDLVDEFGRNFAFTSQEINDRTAPLVLDFGGLDADGDGISDAAERYRIATSAGRLVGDANGDGVIDDLDRRVFDDRGRQVGITLTEALEQILGLVRYDEDATPTASLTPLERSRSFSVRTVSVPGGTVTVLWRVRDVATGTQRRWEVLTTTGIDRGVDFDDRVLRTEDGLTLAFVQDADGDRVTARWEYLMGCSDDLVDTDGDGIGDYDEIYTGWEVVLPTGSYRVYPSCARRDSDVDGLTDLQERTLGTDPLKVDTDGDGVSDFDEVNGYRITLRFGIVPTVGCTAVVGMANTVTCTSDPLDPDTDGDTLSDGDERRLGTNPRLADGDRALDDDRDGLVNFEETSGWSVTFRAVSTVPGQQGATITCTPADFAACGVPPTSDPRLRDTDGDGLPDGVERLLGLHPRLADTDGDGISDFDEVRFVVGENRWEYVYDPLDADMDDDLRSDGDEVNIPLTIRVFGTAPYQVFSNPRVADADNDGLVDGREQFTRMVGGVATVFHTDPTVFDTDGDGTSDRVEVDRNLDGDPTNDTDPLRPDQLLRFAFDGLAIENGAFSLICGDTDRVNAGHFLGRLYYTVNGAETQLTTAANGFSDTWGFDRYFNASAWTSIGAVTVIYRGGSISARGDRLRAVENVDGVQRDMNPINPSNDPVVTSGGGAFTPILNQDPRIWRTDVVGTTNACTMEIRFSITPVP